MIECRIKKELSRIESENLLTAAGFNLRNIYSKVSDGEYIFCTQKDEFAAFIPCKVLDPEEYKELQSLAVVNTPPVFIGESGNIEFHFGGIVDEEFSVGAMIPKRKKKNVGVDN